MNDIKIHISNTEINLGQWERLIETSSYSSFFQSPACYNFYESLSFLKPFVFGVSEDGELKGLICGYLIADGGFLKQFFSRRAIIPGGVLIAGDISKVALEVLLKTMANDLKNSAIYIEIRNYKDYSFLRYDFERLGFAYFSHLNFHVPTPDIELSLKQLSTTKRRDVRVSIREGAEIIEISSENELNEYYNVLKDLYQSKIKLPLFPYEFFSKLIENKTGKIFGIKFDGKIIGGSTCVCLENKVVYEWFVCGLDGKYKNIYPSTLATWAAIEYASKNGYKYFDMMGAGKPDDGYGVREFKAKFGGEIVEYGRFLHVCNRLLYKTGEFAIKWLRKKK